MDREDVYTLADGSVFTGSQALNLGLVDTLGSLYDAVELAGDLAGMGPEPDVVRPRRRESSTLLDLLTGVLGGVSGLGDAVKQAQDGPQLQYLYR
jgi:protease-4